MSTVYCILYVLCIVCNVYYHQGRGEGGDYLHPGETRDRLAKAQADRGEDGQPQRDEEEAGPAHLPREPQEDGLQQERFLYVTHSTLCRKISTMPLLHVEMFIQFYTL